MKRLTKRIVAENGKSIIDYSDARVGEFLHDHKAGNYSSGNYKEVPLKQRESRSSVGRNGDEGMREILFRGKRQDNGEWIKGCLLIDYVSGQYFIHASGNSVNESNKTNEDGRLQFVAFEVDPETVCHYTNAIAIGGKKIYEHDIVIVEKDGAIGIVKFGKYGNSFHFGFYIEWINCPHFRNELYFWESNVKVIGNIFDNPELLKENG